MIGSVIHWFIERSTSKMTLADLADRLQASSSEVARRIQSATARPQNQKQARHIIGIERWGQQRLRVALGGPLVMDEHDAYRPDESASLEALSKAFVTTRADTIALARKLQQANLAPTLTIPHNDLADLTVRGWLYYLDVHATRESAKLG